MNEHLESVASVLDARALPHRLRTGHWSEQSGPGIRSLRSVAGAEFVQNGSAIETARLFVRDECVLAGGRIAANFHSPGGTLILDGGRSARAPAIVFHVHTANVIIYLNLDDLEPVRGRPLHLQVTFYNGENQLFYWGEGASSVETRCVIDGDRRAISVGRDAMLSNGIYLRTHDGHALVDISSREILNPGGDIEIGAHVWVAQDVLVLGEAAIGAGSVIGAKSMVKGAIPKTCVAAGVPAKVIRHEISWGRVPNSTHFLEEELKDLI